MILWQHSGDICSLLIIVNAFPHHNWYDSLCGNLDKIKLDRKMGGIPTMSQSHSMLTHTSTGLSVVSTHNLPFIDRLKCIWEKFSYKSQQCTNVVTENWKCMVGLIKYNWLIHFQNQWHMSSNLLKDSTYVVFQLCKLDKIYLWVILIILTVTNWTLNVNIRSRNSTLIHRISGSINHLPDIDRNWLEEIWVNSLIWLSVAIIETQMSIQNYWHTKNAVTYD